MSSRFVLIRSGMAMRRIGEIRPDGSVEVVAEVEIADPPDDPRWDRAPAIERRAVELVQLLNLGNDLTGVDMASITGPGSGSR